MKLFFINEFIKEGNVLDNTTFNISQTAENEYIIKAFYQGNQVAHLNLDIMIDMYDYFMGSFSEEEYDEMFPNNECAFISEVETYAFRGEGIARKMMNMGLNKAKSLGMSRFYLNASPKTDEIRDANGKPLEMTELTNFYKSFGFNEIKKGPYNVEMLKVTDNLYESKILIIKKLNEIKKGLL